MLKSNFEKADGLGICNSLFEVANQRKIQDKGSLQEFHL